MTHILDYLGRRFYQLTSTEKPDRAGTSRMLLSLFCLFLLLDVYTLFSLLLGNRPQFGLAALACFVLAQVIVQLYARRPAYQQQLVLYAAPEPERVRLALAGVALLLLVCLLPFLLLRLLQ